MTATDWAVHLEPNPLGGPLTETDRQYPLATQRGISALTNFLNANAVWKALSRPQRELLLSCAAGWPILARADVVARMVRRGLITDGLAATDAGLFIIAWRIP